MKYEEAAKKVDSLHKKVVAMNEEIAKVRRSAEPQAMKDYVFTRSTCDSATWQDLFGRKKDLMVIRGTTFAEDTGYGGDGGFMPGVSVFQKQKGKDVRVSDTGFGPGDIYCSVWHLLDLLPQGSDGWRPKYSY